MKNEKGTIVLAGGVIGRNGICAAGHWRDEQRMTLLVVQSDEKCGILPHFSHKYLN